MSYKKIIIRNSYTYLFLNYILRIFLFKNKNIPFKIWVYFLLSNLREAHKKGRPTIWTNAFGPVEIIYAMGAVPFIPEIIASVVAYLGRSRQFLDQSQGHISTDLCSFLRCAYGLMLEDLLPKPELIFTCAQICDGATKFFNLASRFYGVPHIIIDAPFKEDIHSQRYVREQLKEAIEEIDGTVGPLLKIGNSPCLKYLRNSWLMMKKINYLRRSKPAPFPGSDALSYLLGMRFYSMGSRWAMLFFYYLLSDIQKDVLKKRGYLSKERYRLLWLHHIRPYYKNEIFDILNRWGASVCFEEANYIHWNPFKSEDLIDVITDKIISNVWIGPIDRRISAIEEMIADYKVQGVIHFSNWGCRQSSAGAHMIGEFLRNRGIPFVIIPGDGADPDNYSMGQTRTRLEAFLEMLD